METEVVLGLFYFNCNICLGQGLGVPITNYFKCTFPSPTPKIRSHVLGEETILLIESSIVSSNCSISRNKNWNKKKWILKSLPRVLSLFKRISNLRCQNKTLTTWLSKSLPSPKSRVFLHPYYLIIWLSNLLTLRYPNECYSTNVPYALN